jgi:hypothetical protein
MLPVTLAPFYRNKHSFGQYELKDKFMGLKAVSAGCAARRLFN